MTKSKKPSQGWLSWAQCVLFVGVLVGATLFHVWQKVEMARVASAIHTAQTRSVDLGKERAKLLAAVAIKKNPAIRSRLARLVKMVSFLYVRNALLQPGSPRN